MSKPRMTKAEKAFYWTIWNGLKAGTKPETLPGPVWLKWVDLQLNKTF